MRVDPLSYTRVLPVRRDGRTPAGYTRFHESVALDAINVYSLPDGFPKESRPPNEMTVAVLSRGLMARFDMKGTAADELFWRHSCVKRSNCHVSPSTAAAPLPDGP